MGSARLVHSPPRPVQQTAGEPAHEQRDCAAQNASEPSAISRTRTAPDTLGICSARSSQPAQPQNSTARQLSSGSRVSRCVKSCPHVWCHRRLLAASEQVEAAEKGPQRACQQMLWPLSPCSSVTSLSALACRVPAGLSHAQHAACGSLSQRAHSQAEQRLRHAFDRPWNLWCASPDCRQGCLATLCATCALLKVAGVRRPERGRLRAGCAHGPALGLPPH